ncbi:MAG TPA: EamA family transporter, partial [Butyricimonas sp.]|nr:EamA family transporter [Butyricimonas sp.]
AYLLLRRVDLRITLKEFGTMFLLGGAYASTSLFLTASYLYIPSGVATTIHFLYP